MERNVKPNRMTRRALKSLIVKRLQKRLRGFEAEDDGGMTIISLFIFILMLTMGGISVDIMRHEAERTALQATLDSAVLAGAGAPAGASKEDIRAIVEDFFIKSGKAEYLNTITDEDIVTTVNSRRVSASADKTVNTYLMKLMGVNEIKAGGGATAEVRTPKLEVALVLDVSGSMRGSKLTNLQTAAKEFVTTILNASDPGNTVISIVPFSWTTAPGEAIFTAMQDNVDDTHDYSSCLRFSEEHYSEAFIDPTREDGDAPEYDQQIYTSIYGDFDDLNSSWRSCFNDDYAEIMAFSISEQQLHDRIDLLYADGNTSGHIGMKWGAALLDPAFQTVTTSLQNQSVVDASLANIPALYNEPDTMKVIVMMGDGANTHSYYFDEDSNFRGPNSDLYKVEYQNMEFDYARHKYRNRTSTNENRCTRNNWVCYYTPTGPVQSVYYLRDGDEYYNIDEDEWIDDDEFDDLENTLNGYLDTERLDWEDAWGLMSPNYYGSITGNWSAWNDYVGSEFEDGSEKNELMSDICTATKNNGVVVYTIGFEVPANGTAEVELRDCATSTINYYRASGVNISDAFGSIASNVQNLRLTQ